MTRAASSASSSSAAWSDRSRARPTASRPSGSEARADRNPDFFFGTGFGSDINGLHAQPVPRPNAAQNPVQYPFHSFDGGSVIDRQRSGTRLYDVNVDGVDHYGLYPDWIEDLRKVAGPQIVEDLANGAEAYLQLWERAEAAADQ